MTRTECEAKIEAHVEAIIGIVKEYNPDCQYLVACYIGSDSRTYYHFNNAHFEEDSTDEKYPIDFTKWIRKENA